MPWSAARAIGTGVAIEPDRLLTNCHVIAPNVLKGKIYAISAVTGASRRDHRSRLSGQAKTPASCMPPALARRRLRWGTPRACSGVRGMHNVGFGGGDLVLAQGLYLGSLQRFGQYYMLSTNACMPGCVRRSAGG
jgi:serine protease Do